LMWRLKKKKKWERERERGRKREEWASIVLLGCHPSIQNHPPTTIPSHYYDNEQLWKIFRQNLNSAQIDSPPPPDLSIGNHPLPPIPSSSLCSDFRVYFSLPTPLRIQKSLISSNLHNPPPPYLAFTWNRGIFLLFFNKENTKQYTICFFIVIFFDLLVPTSKWGWGFSMTSNPGMSRPQNLSSAISHPVDISGERDILSQHHPFFAKYVKTQLLQCIY
jgi:hypothetical protein